MRLHFDGVNALLGGDLGDDPDVDTTITFAAKLTDLSGDVPTITDGDYLLLRVGDELIHLVDYTTGATTGTVVRAVEGSQIDAHSEGDRVWHPISSADAVTVSDEAPAEPQLGQLWVDTATRVGVVDVTDYGATGDGETDDTAAIAAAAQDARTYGLALYFPRGIYVSDPIEVAGAAGVFGDGWGSTLQLRAQNTSGLGSAFAVLQCFGSASVIIEGFFVRDLKIDGNRANMSGSTTVDMECLNLKYVHRGLIENVLCVNAISDGFDLDFCEDTTVIGCHAVGCGGGGFHASNGTERCSFVACVAENCGHVGSRSGFDQYTFDGVPANANRWVGCLARDCYRNWDITGGSQAATLIGCDSINGDQADIFTAAMHTGAYDDMAGA